MAEKQRTYIAIDLKSFFASVECVERGLDPLTTNLVVADESRTVKTICLAVSPSLKAYGISGRARLFEVVQRVREVNRARRHAAPQGRFTDSSTSDPELKSRADLELSYIVAPPRMTYYIDYSTRVYKIYLQYVSQDDIHVYSIDEVFIDATDYLRLYNVTAHELALRMIRDVLAQTGITATAGIGSNLYLCKVAMDIVAKHIPADKDGVRIAELDEMSYRRQLWDHQPLTDFWRVGKGTARRLEQYGIHTMGQIARCSVRSEELLYKLFGVNAELLIDHAWGWEPCSLDYVKAYRPETSSLNSGQVLSEPYSFSKGRIVALEMAEAMVLSLVEKRLVTDQIALTISYDAANQKNPSLGEKYQGEFTTDYYGRPVPKHAHGTANLGRHTSSTRLISKAVADLFDRIVNPSLLIRRLNLTCNHVIPESEAPTDPAPLQLDLFSDSQTDTHRLEEEETSLRRERRMQEALLDIKKKYGKNAIVRGLDFEDGATTIQRNNQIGGHKA